MWSEPHDLPVIERSLCCCGAATRTPRATSRPTRRAGPSPFPFHPDEGRRGFLATRRRRLDGRPHCAARLEEQDSPHARPDSGSHPYRPSDRSGTRGGPTVDTSKRRRHGRSVLPGKRSARRVDVGPSPTLPVNDAGPRGRRLRRGAHRPAGASRTRRASQRRDPSAVRARRRAARAERTIAPDGRGGVTHARLDACSRV
jgi:hypothetical protein